MLTTRQWIQVTGFLVLLLAGGIFGITFGSPAGNSVMVVGGILLIAIAFFTLTKGIIYQRQLRKGKSRINDRPETPTRRERAPES